MACSDAYFRIITVGIVCLASRDDVRGLNGEEENIHSFHYDVYWILQKFTVSVPFLVQDPFTSLGMMEEEKVLERGFKVKEIFKTEKT